MHLSESSIELQLDCIIEIFLTGLQSTAYGYSLNTITSSTYYQDRQSPRTALPLPTTLPYIAQDR